MCVCLSLCVCLFVYVCVCVPCLVTGPCKWETSKLEYHTQGTLHPTCCLSEYHTSFPRLHASQALKRFWSLCCIDLLCGQDYCCFMYHCHTYQPVNAAAKYWRFILTLALCKGSLLLTRSVMQRVLHRACKTMTSQVLARRVSHISRFLKCNEEYGYCKRGRDGAYGYQWCSFNYSQHIPHNFSPKHSSILILIMLYWTFGP